MGKTHVGKTAQNVGGMPGMPQQNPLIDCFGKQQDKWRAVYAERCTYGSGGRAAVASRLSLNLPHDSAVFLGGKEKQTLEEWSKLLGKETIDSYNNSETKGNSPSYGKNFQKLGKELMSVDELAVMDGEMCILQLRGVRPFFSRKYDITKHPLYRQLADYDKRNSFDVAKHLSTRLRIRADDEFEVYGLNPLVPPKGNAA